MENQTKSSNCYDIEVEEKTFLKMKSHMEKDGYREGIEEARNRVFQKYFDDGYAHGFKNGLILGKLKGKIWAESISKEKKLIPIVELDNSTRGACIICKDEKSISLPISKIQSEQTEVLNNIVANIENKTEVKTVI